MTVIAGHDPLDPTSAREPVPDYEAALDRRPARLRIGVPTTVFLDGADDPVVAAMEAALLVLAARGAIISRMTLPLMDAVVRLWRHRLPRGGRHDPLPMDADRPQDYAVHLSARMYPGYAIPGTYYVEALSRRGPVLRAFAKEVFGKVDVLVTPTIKTILPTLAATDIDHGPPGTEHTFLAVSANTRPFNYLGLPAISVPCGFDPNGCPIGLQIAGRPFAEARLLHIADAYQRDTSCIGRVRGCCRGNCRTGTTGLGTTERDRGAGHSASTL